jgi:hypothetical protein
MTGSANWDTTQRWFIATWAKKRTDIRRDGRRGRQVVTGHMNDSIAVAASPRLRVSASPLFGFL